MIDPSTHPAGTDDETDQDARPPSNHRGRIAGLLILFVILLLIAFVPPLFKVNRFQRRIATNISTALGRPVHFNNVSLVLLPMPGFTLDNFVVEEDPAFGSEPVLHSDQVRVTLRISSLWRRRVEFSKISLAESTSVNLVRLDNGKWNVEDLFLRASQIEAAPTSQRFASAAPRFPYIEATGARLNLKLGQEKTPFSLTDAEFALWLPEPHQWHLRLEAHPTRTDTSSGDTGTLRAEGILGAADMHADSLADIPLDLYGDLRDAQLGGLSRLMLGADSGVRGDISLSFALRGTVGHNAVTANIKLAKARRADFVPDHLLALETSCSATALGTFHAFANIECHWPPADSSDPSVLILTGDLPDARNPDTASVSITLPALPSRTFFDWLTVATPHPPTAFAAAGTLSGTVKWNPAYGKSPVDPADPRLKPGEALPEWSGDLELSNESLQIPALGPGPIPLGDIQLQSAPGVSDHFVSQNGFDLQPISLPLGGKLPATLEGHFDANGYTLHLTGNVIPARLLALGDAIPQLGDGLRDLLIPAPAAPDQPAPAARHGRNSFAPAPTDEVPADDATPVHLDITATRAWGGPQTWHETTPPPPHHPTRK